MSSTILIIEDEADIREVYTDVLKEAGFTVTEATDGEVGLSAALAGGWDLLLLDIMLPKIDGLEILKKVRGQENLSHKPVVLLTNLGRESIIKEGFEVGANGYLIKSELTPDQVVSEVKGFLNK